MVEFELMAISIFNKVVLNCLIKSHLIRMCHCLVDAVAISRGTNCIVRVGEQKSQMCESKDCRDWLSKRQVDGSWRDFRTRELFNHLLDSVRQATAANWLAIPNHCWRVMRRLLNFWVKQPPTSLIIRSLPFRQKWSELMCARLSRTKPTETPY